MASFLSSDWDITPEMEAELDRIQAEEPLPDPDEEDDDQGTDVADSRKDSTADGK